MNVMNVINVENGRLNLIFRPNQLSLVNRKSFLANATIGLLGAAIFQPFHLISGTRPKGPVIGHGDFRYRVNDKWGILDARVPVKDCHEMVMDKRKRIFLLTNETRNNIIIYDRSGKLLGTWGNQFPGGHGLTIHDEGGEEFLYITDHELGEVYKATLDGRILMTIKHPKLIGQYGDCDKFKPTETCVGPNGDIYIADGYGSQFILQYSAKGEFIRKFGGDSFGEKYFKQAHGVTLDVRNPNDPVLMCTDRVKTCFKIFSLDGTYRSSIQMPGAYVSRAVFDGEYLYSGVCFSALKNHMLTYNAGFVTILNGSNKVVSNPGGTKPVYKNGDLSPMVQGVPVFKHCHDVCIDPDKNVFVAQWNAGNTYPYMLERV
jgi:hypothetical protein